VEVFQDDEQRLNGGGAGQEAADPLHQPVALLLRVFLGARLDLEPVAYLRDDAGYVGRPGTQFFTQVFHRPRQYVRPHGFNKRQVGQR
jgi:hypothetical protein